MSPQPKSLKQLKKVTVPSCQSAVIGFRSQDYHPLLITVSGKNVN